MNATISVRQLESVPDGATVHDFDELPDSVKSGIADAVAASETSVSVDDDDRTSIETIDVVRFTEYYRVKRSEAVLDR